MAISQLTLADIGTSVDELEAFHSMYQAFFEPYAYESSVSYLHSTFVCEKRRNIANRARAVPDGNIQNMRHFLSNGTGDNSPIINQFQGDTYDLIGSAKEGALIIDESGLPKKGTHSVGVARQYCGATGKVP